MRQPLMTSERCLLFVGAHPDDESFGLGGTLAHYALAGAQVFYACATRGDVGAAAPEHLAGHATVGDMRWAELQCAAQALGLAGLIHLGYRDSGMPGSPDNTALGALAAAPENEVVERVVQVLRERRPQVVLTFDPIGGYKHPDHIAIHKATVKAFHAAGDAAQFPAAGPAWQPQKLYFHVFPKGMLKLAVRLLPLFGRDPRKFGNNGDIDIADLARYEFPTHALVSIEPAAARAKQAASACHQSQLAGGPAARGLVGWLSRLAAQRDAYMRAWPAPRPGEPKEADLFAGVTA
ncbi:MAG: PIG-L family deacetylase [Anaerolineales bacterium]|nr:PIG-L family deacetylase [Anaerolineales bacterium]